MDVLCHIAVSYSFLSLPYLLIALENVDFNPEGPTGRYRLVFEDIFFRPPITSEEVGIQTIDDSISEPTESFTCALRLTVNPLDPIQSTHPDTVLISIIDDDSELRSGICNLQIDVSIHSLVGCSVVEYLLQILCIVYSSLTGGEDIHQ